MTTASSRGFIAIARSTTLPRCRILAPCTRGVDGVRKWMKDMREVVGMGFGFEPRGHTTGGDVVLIEAIARGVGQGSGIPLEFTTFLVFEMRDGKIARAQGFLRRDHALEAAGLGE